MSLKTNFHQCSKTLTDATKIRSEQIQHLHLLLKVMRNEIKKDKNGSPHSERTKPESFPSSHGMESQTYRVCVAVAPLSARSSRGVVGTGLLTSLMGGNPLTK